MTQTNSSQPKQLPHDPDAERAVLGAILLSGRALDTAGMILQPEDFSLLRHRRIYAAMLAMGIDAAEIDYLALCDRLTAQGQLEEAGGLSYISELTLTVAGAAQVATHAGIVRAHAIRRQLIRMLSDSTERLYDGAGPEAVGQETQADIFKLLSGRESRSWKASQEVMIDTIDFCQRMQEQESQRLLGIPWGLALLDDMTGGSQRGTLTIVGGRPSMGKTSLGLRAAIEAAMRGFSVGIASLEMTSRQLGLRLLTIGVQGEERVSLNLAGLRRGEKLAPGQWAAVVRASDRVAPLPLYVDDTPMHTLQSLRAKARQLQTTRGLDVLVIDYLQLMTVTGGIRREGLEDISRGLKLMAKELDIAVIAMAQLSRKVEERDDKRPVMADLRESGAIEQDADIVLMLYRDEYYNGATSAFPGQAEILVRKNRDGQTGEVLVAWQASSASFENN